MSYDVFYIYIYISLVEAPRKTVSLGTILVPSGALLLDGHLGPRGGANDLLRSQKRHGKPHIVRPAPPVHPVAWDPNSAKDVLVAVEP